MAVAKSLHTVISKKNMRVLRTTTTRPQKRNSLTVLLRDPVVYFAYALYRVPADKRPWNEELDNQTKLDPKDWKTVIP